MNRCSQGARLWQRLEVSWSYRLWGPKFELSSELEKRKLLISPEFEPWGGRGCPSVRENKTLTPVIRKLIN